MSIVVKQDSENPAIELGERFDFNSVEQFRACYESLADIKKKTLEIDFRNTRYMDSSALGMLINAKSFFDTKNVKIIINNANDQIKKILVISRFDLRFEIR